MSIADTEAIATGVFAVFWLVAAVASFRHRGTWRYPAICLVAICEALTVAELQGTVFSGPGGGQHGDIPVP